MKLKIHTTIQTLPAYNWVLFDIYTTIARYCVTHKVDEDIKITQEAVNLIEHNKLDDALRVLNNWNVALQINKQGRIPYNYLAYDCLIKTETPNLIDEEECLSFQEMIFYDYINEMNDWFKSQFNEKIQSNFGHRKFFSKYRESQSEDLRFIIQKLKGLEIGDNVNELAFELLGRQLKDYEVPHITDYKDTYLKQIVDSVKVLGFSKLDDLKNISTFEYYALMCAKYDEHKERERIMNQRKKKN